MTVTSDAKDTAAQQAADPSLGQLVSEASESLSTIIRGELELAKLELRSSFRFGGIGVALFAAAGVLLAFSLTFGLIALAEGLIAAGLYRWLGYLVVFVALVVIVIVMVIVGIKLVKRVKAPTKTIETSRETIDYLRSHPKSVT